MLNLRLANEADCADLVQLFDLSNNGLSRFSFAAMAPPGEDWAAYGAAMMAQGDVEYSYANAVIAEWDGARAGMMIYAVHPESMPLVDPQSIAATDRAFLVLKQHTGGALYLRNMAVFPEFRGRRIGEALVSATIGAGVRIGLTAVTAIVHETNTLLLAHYARRGMAEIARHPVLEHPSYAADSTWILLKGDANRAMSLADKAG